MQVFRRSARQLSEGILYTALATFSAFIVLTMLFPQLSVFFSLPFSLLCGLLMGWFEIAETSIRIELQPDTLRYYKRGNLLRTVILSDYTVSQRRSVIRKSTQNLWLEFRKNDGSGQIEFAIDCMPLGEQAFIDLYYLITS